MKLYEKNGNKNRTGAIGEAVTQQHLKTHGFAINEVNYLKKLGEIDVVAQKSNCVHFIEVKTVSYETRRELELAISRGTWRPEENVHRLKLRNVARTAEVWLKERGWTGEWQIDVAAVRIVPKEKFATIKLIENVIVE